MHECTKDITSIRVFYHFIYLFGDYCKGFHNWGVLLYKYGHFISVFYIICGDFSFDYKLFQRKN